MSFQLVAPNARDCRRRRPVRFAGGGRKPLTVTELKSPPAALPTTVRVPQHVVYREFIAETVVLNLNTGIYHGLNPTGGRMLKLLDELGDVGVVAARLAGEYRRPRSEVAADLETFCRDLLARDLIESVSGRS
jgi:hypothetical protein